MRLLDPFWRAAAMAMLSGLVMPCSLAQAPSAAQSAAQSAAPSAAPSAALSAPAAARPAASASAARVAGWVNPDPDTGKLPLRAFSVLRKGKRVAYDESLLQACDVVDLVDPEVTVHITLANSRRQRLGVTKDATRSLRVPCTERGMPESLIAALQAAIGGPETRAERAAAMASRSIDTGASRAKPALAAPVLDAQTNTLLAGQRAVFLRWVGGTAPFTVALQDSTGRVLASRTGLRTREVRLPSVRLQPGRHRLLIGQARGESVVGIAEDALEVAPAEHLPAAPPALVQALEQSGLPADARTIFRADQLASLEGGRWTLEAAQSVAAIQPATAASRQWLDRHAGVLQSP
jgi:hypothetical protein